MKKLFLSEAEWKVRRKGQSKKSYLNQKLKDPEKFKAKSKRGTLYQANNPDKKKEYQQRWKTTNPESYQKSNRKRHLKKTFGLTIEEVEQMVINQRHQCAICNQVRELEVDHCHTTEKVRGLLCGECNRAIGLFDDNITTMQNAITYIKET